MPNEEQLSTLKQGIEAWQKWRDHNMDVKIELDRADLSETNLSGIHLIGANLSGANLSKAKLTGANLREADLRGANFRGADLKAAHLRGANLKSADLRETYLAKTELISVHLGGAKLSSANLKGTYLSGAKFNAAVFGGTQFSNINLSETTGLDDVTHDGPSTIGSDTLARSNGKISEVFLRGCGLSDWEIEMAKLYDPQLSNEERNKVLYKIYDLQSSQAIQISPLFISYSHKDGTFVDRLEVHLNKSGVRFWRDIHDMKAGRIEKQVDRAIRQNPTVVLVLSKSAQQSDWVEHEVRTARELEKEMKRDVLCPVTLDDSWKSSPWPKRVMEQIMEYNILDFSEWKDDGKFEGMFRKLSDGLQLFYKD